jgi:hypothetical protein
MQNDKKINRAILNFKNQMDKMANKYGCSIQVKTSFSPLLKHDPQQSEWVTIARPKNNKHSEPVAQPDVGSRAGCVHAG